MAGYIGRILMHDNPWSTSAFRLQIICLILAPTFIAAGCDVVSILLQAAGGGVVNSAGLDKVWMDAGNTIVTVGIAFQVATMSACGLFAVDFFIAFWKDRRRQRKTEGASFGDTRNKRILNMLIAEMVAYLMVLILCIYRLPEMAGGWGSSLMRNEREFMGLDGASLVNILPLA
ncbi:hypothetical protein N7481_004303 [Penicillium waksmanii]|uniref:uncharacterized protein n=1 Tax=Penicillium waksmanii TaxID=69791 RepID=UPI0025474EAC|nr:uncharacterized protein N7481_004303 [Penicillium waksmanii]KAJ5989093.1 hypothetical protein N7481_004303 [Penicillium waksmanii]